MPAKFLLINGIRCHPAFPSRVLRNFPKPAILLPMHSHGIALLLIASLPAAAQGSHDHAHPLGRVHFPVSCTPAAQQTFEHGVALLHSFWYDEAERTFAQVTRTDPTCAMGYWGAAMSFYHPVWAPPTADDLKKGAAAVARAKSAGAKTRRERDYIAAIEAFYRDSEKLPHRERALAWRNAMQELSA